MTITATTTAPDRHLISFGFGVGLPNLYTLMSDDDHLCEEDFFLDGLRGYVSAAARQCHRDTPIEYEDFIADLTEVSDDESPTRRSARFTHLLHTYADYIPAPDCDYVDLPDPDRHGWMDPDGHVIFDIVTTLTMIELSPNTSACMVIRATSEGRANYGPMFAGVRNIVLDAPYESTWHPSVGEPQPLIGSDLTFRSADGGEML